MKVKTSLTIYLLVLLFLGWNVAIARATAKPSIEVTGEGKISVVVENGSINDLLRSMSDRKLFEVKGALPGGEITLHLSNLTVEEAMKKIMRGYNYVFINQGASRKPLLLLLGKVEPGKSAMEQPQPAGRPAPPINQPQNQTSEPRMYVPPVTIPQAPPSPQLTSPGRPSQAPGRVPGPPAGGVPAPGVPGNPTPPTTPAEQTGPMQQEPDKGEARDGQTLDRGPNAGQGQENQQPGGVQSSGVSTRDLLNQSRVQ